MSDLIHITTWIAVIVFFTLTIVSICIIIREGIKKIIEKLKDNQ